MASKSLPITLSANLLTNEMFYKITEGGEFYKVELVAMDDINNQVYALIEGSTRGSVLRPQETVMAVHQDNVRVVGNHGVFLSATCPVCETSDFHRKPQYETSAVQCEHCGSVFYISPTVTEI